MKHPPARYATLPTPPGPFTIVVTDLDGEEVVLASGWTDDLGELLPVVHRSLRPDSVELVESLPAFDTVEAFCAGEVTAIDEVAVRQRSGPFLEDAWEVLRTVPPGQPDTYAAFAVRCGRPSAVRAAAGACARNAAALFVPCHRVLATGGGLGGFRWGTPVKRWLLDHEAAHAPVAVEAPVALHPVPVEPQEALHPVSDRAPGGKPPRPRAPTTELSHR